MVIATFWHRWQAWRLQQASQRYLRRYPVTAQANLPTTLATQLTTLRREGWDFAACRAYVTVLTNQQPAPAPAAQLDQAWRQLHRVGSDLYTTMLRASRLAPAAKLRLMLTGHLQAAVDPHGFLQLNATGQAVYRFSAQLNPLCDFYPLVRQLVCQAYGRTGLGRDALGHQLHCFRSYLDRAALAYLRAYPHPQPAATDYQRLLQFLADHQLRADYTTNASLHNRTAQPFTYPHNMKVQLTANDPAWRYNRGRMIELIVDLTSEQFVSEWNAYQHHRRANGQVDARGQGYQTAELAQIANTESFNYGIPHGAHHVPYPYRHTHQRLDVDHPQDPAIRRFALTGRLQAPTGQIIIKGQAAYRAPKTLAAGGNYVNIVSGGQVADLRAWQAVPADQRAIVYRRYVQWVKADRRHRQYAGFAAFCGDTKNAPTPTSGIDAF